MINYSEINEYDDLENLNIAFKGNPRKDLETDIYKVYLETPIVLQLPKSKISQINEDVNEKSIVTYVLEDETLVEFFDNLDAYIINISNRHSIKWFGTNLDQKLLMRFYQNVYTIENHIKTLTFFINDDDLDEVSNYNIDEDLEIQISIKSIDIFKRTFRLNLELEALVYSDDVLEEEVDFEKLINSQKNVCETSIVDNSNFTKKEADLSDTTALRNEVLELIKTKELEKEQILTNTERVDTASQTLKKRATLLDTEIQSFKEKLDSL